jgi:hypothetical protein
MCQQGRYAPVTHADLHVVLRHTVSLSDSSDNAVTKSQRAQMKNARALDAVHFSQAPANRCAILDSS